MISPFGVEHDIAKRDEAKITKDAFGVEKAYTSKEKSRMAGGAAVGGTIGGLYLGGPASVAANYGGQVANIKATKMKREYENGARAKSPFEGNPHYQKWKKAQNLADRAGTPGEQQAAQSMAEKISANHGPFSTPKVKPLGRSYKTLRTLGRLSNPKTALATGFGSMAAVGAGVGVAAQRNTIRQEQAARARRKKAA